MALTGIGLGNSAAIAAGASSAAATVVVRSQCLAAAEQHAQARAPRCFRMPIDLPPQIKRARSVNNRYH
jgi:hypothetical protein